MDLGLGLTSPRGQIPYGHDMRDQGGYRESHFRRLLLEVGASREESVAGVV